MTAGRDLKVGLIQPLQGEILNPTSFSSRSHFSLAHALRGVGSSPPNKGLGPFCGQSSLSSGFCCWD